MTRKIAVILGTRPEVIKLAPLVLALRRSARLAPVIVASGQHRELSEQAFEAFRLTPDINLDLMQADQKPAQFLAEVIAALDKELPRLGVVCAVVQGDTSTALGGALSAFHHKIPVAHVEAGLRTYNMYAPFPEEMNRQLISRLASFHFCPTNANKLNLDGEGIVDGTFVVGNTVLDALEHTRAELRAGRLKPSAEVGGLTEEVSGPFILVTGHRRENFDAPLKRLCASLRELLNAFPSFRVIFPIHPNPNVESTIREELGTVPHVHLLPPLDYPSMVYLMERAKLIISDSGGIQEEIRSLGTPLIVTRAVTERPEALGNGFAKLCELDKAESLFTMARALLQQSPGSNAGRPNPFGDGRAAEHITQRLESLLG